MKHTACLLLALAACAGPAPRPEYVRYVPPSPSEKPVVTRVALPTGVTLAVHEAGAPGGAPVIFLHGYTDTRRSFAAVADALRARAPGLRLIGLDLRGHGESTMPPAAECAGAPERCFRVVDFAADVLAFMDRQNIPRAHLVGHSLGSFVAQQLAFARPERVSSITLVGSAARVVGNSAIAEHIFGGLIEGTWRPALEARGHRWPADAYDRTPLDADPAAEAWLGQNWVVEPDGDPRLLAAILPETARTRLGTWIGVARAVVELDHTERLRRLTVPALVLSAAGDEVFPAAERERLRAALAAAAETCGTKLIDRELDAGHNLPWSEGEAIAAEIAAFVAAPAPAGRCPLGTHHRRITTTSPEAQRAFDRGLAYLYAFNHDEAIRAFREAEAADPAAAMPPWAIALALGPHINLPFVPADRAAEAWRALGRARARAAGASPVELALIAALATRYASPQPADRRPLDVAYAGAMREVVRAHPDDVDARALFAEALMDLRPWDLWTADGKPQPGTDEVVATLDAVLERDPRHPLANHLLIHALEASPQPEKADAAAARLRDLAPGLAHMVHMPTHIDVRRGRWKEAMVSNAAAIEADRRYRAARADIGFYRVYIAHNRHMLAFAAMMTGRSELAIATVREMVDEMPAAWKRDNAAFADGYLGMPFEVLLRFGRWEEILAAPEPDARMPIARALRHYARGVACTATGRLAEARAEERRFLAARRAVPADAFFGNNAAADLLGVAEKMLRGEILYREGQVEAGFAALREAVAREDRLRYDEPPDWIQPVRHALGAALLRSGRAVEAEAVYREDLARLPNNVWSLVGLARSLRLQGLQAEAGAVEQQLAEAGADADIVLTTSCLCLPGI